MDYLAAMRIYIRVVERGSMSAAARDLGIGQSSVSERIDRLEATLGVRLLQRNTRSLLVTDAGTAFYERSRLAIEAADEALATAGQHDRQLQGLLRLAAPHGLGEVVLPRILADLRRLYPQLKIELTLNDRRVDPVTEGVDLSLRLGQLGDGYFTAHPLGQVARVLVASADYLDQHPAPIRPEDLAAHPFARVRGLFGQGRLGLLDADRQPLSVPVDIVLTASHWRPVYAMVLQGVAIGVLQMPVCAADLATGRLQRILPDLIVPGFDLHAIVPADRPVPWRTRMVLAYLQQVMPGLLPGGQSGGSAPV